MDPRMLETPDCGVGRAKVEEMRQDRASVMEVEARILKCVVGEVANVESK
jgi:hypothetical protein